MPQVEVDYLPVCFANNNPLKNYLIFFPAFIFLFPITTLLRLGINPNSTLKGRLYYFVPLFLLVISLGLNYLTESLRPFKQCLTPLHTAFGWPAPEIVLAESYFWVEILYGVVYIQEVDTWMPLVRLAGYIIVLAAIPTLAYMTFTVSFDQLVISMVISLCTIPICMLLVKFYTFYYAKHD